MYFVLIYIRNRILEVKLSFIIRNALKTYRFSKNHGILFY